MEANRKRAMTLTQFQEGLMADIKKLSKKELQEREDFWRALWSWTPEDVKYFIYRIGQIVRVVMRTYRGSIGELGEVKFEPKELELIVYEKHFDETTSKYFYETKVMKLPWSAIMWFEVIQEREEAEQAQVPEVMSLPDLVESEG